MLEEYLGVPHVRCVSSCTAALFLGLLCLGVGPGDEVLLPAMTFVASANVVEHVGATPVLVDSVARYGRDGSRPRRGADQSSDEGDHAGAPGGAPASTSTG